MIHPANERHLDEVLDIEKMVFTHPWSREKLKSDLILNFLYRKLGISEG